MATRIKTTNATETARKMLEAGGGQESMTRAVGFALVGISDQIAYLTSMVEAEQAESEAWRARVNGS